MREKGGRNDLRPQDRKSCDFYRGLDPQVVEGVNPIVNPLPNRTCTTSVLSEGNLNTSCIQDFPDSCPLQTPTTFDNCGYVGGFSVLISTQRGFSVSQTLVIRCNWFGCKSQSSIPSNVHSTYLRCRASRTMNMERMLSVTSVF